MNRIALEFASGGAFFYGIVLSVVATLLSVFLRQTRLGSVLFVASILGAIAVVLSATPLPVWLYILWFLTLTAVHVLLGIQRMRRTRTTYVVAALFVVQTLGMCALELPYHLKPSIPLRGAKTLYVVGDSLCIGAGARERNWPEQLGSLAGLDVVNLSSGGAKLSRALHCPSRVTGPGAVVVVEVGGNDILDSTDPKAFEERLERLLDGLCRPGRLVIMLELPLPPLHNKYGEIQRRLARAQGVSLIPKRCLTGVLGTPGATVDGLHLSDTGQALMAESIGALFDVGAAPSATSQD